MIKKLIQFFSHDIWVKTEEDYKSKKVAWLARQAKILTFMVKGFGDHDILVRSAALTFYTLMSVVPIAALVFAVMKGFGMETNMSNYLYAQLPQYRDAIDQVLEFANNMIQRTKGGVIASVGLVVLFWAVMRVFSNLENALNHIWEVRNQRSFARMFSDYMTVVFVAPVLWLISNSAVIAFKTRIETFADHWIVEVLFGMLSLLAVWVLFAFIYMVMPNTKVKLKSAFTAAMIAGTVFSGFQVAYVYIQSGVSSYNAIYGSFAAIPLFLIWAQTSWQILLSGAELSFAYQNIKRYEQERETATVSYDARRKVLVAVMAAIIRHFMRHTGAVSSEDIAGELNLPVRIVRDVVFDLTRAGLLSAVKDDQDEKVNKYIPACDVHEITVAMVVDKVELNGVHDSSLMESEDMQRAGEILDAMREGDRLSLSNVKLMDIGDESSDVG